MINLIGETLKHPFTGGQWKVIASSGEYVQLTDGTTKDYVPRVQALEMYAEQQKQRADEAEKRADAAEDLVKHIKETLNEMLEDREEEYEYLAQEFVRGQIDVYEFLIESVEDYEEAQKIKRGEA